MTTHVPRYHRSTHREAILDFVRDRRAHLSAEEIYAGLRPNHPRLSMGTVYRNLHILVEQQRLHALHFSNGGDRYDARLEPHYHLACRRCGDVVDVDMPVLDQLDTFVRDHRGSFRIESHTVLFHGLCLACTQFERDVD